MQSRSVRKMVGFFLAACVALATAACGDDGGSSSKDKGPSKIDSGVEESKAIQEISEDEQQQLCDAGDAYAARKLTKPVTENFSCTLMGMMGAGMGGDTEDPVAACEEIKQACLNGEFEEDDADNGDGGEEDDSCNWEGVDECDATVAELEACGTAQIDALAAAMRAASCQDIESADDGEDNPDEETVLPECAPIKEKCPTLYDSLN